MNGVFIQLGQRTAVHDQLPGLQLRPRFRLVPFRHRGRLARQ
jgi:hypothetical protein